MSRITCGFEKLKKERKPSMRVGATMAMLWSSRQ
jgi:hypothetical protein